MSSEPPASSTKEEVTEMTFVWFTYSKDIEVHEAPLAIPIGSLMLVILIAFVIFFVLLDLNSYVKSFRMGYKNCLRGAKDRRKRKSDDEKEGDQVTKLDQWTKTKVRHKSTRVNGVADRLPKLNNMPVTFRDIEDESEYIGS